MRGLLTCRLSLRPLASHALTRRPIPIALVAIGICAAACSHRSPLLEPTPEELAFAGPDSFRVSVETSRGVFEMLVHRDWAPYGADRFYFLLTRGYYEDARFFRAVKGFAVQFGIAGIPAVA